MNRLAKLLEQGTLSSTGYSKEWEMEDHDGVLLVSRVGILFCGSELEYPRRRYKERTLHESTREFLPCGSIRVTRVTVRLSVFGDGSSKLTIYFRQQVFEQETCITSVSWEESSRPATDLDEVCALAG